MGYGLRNLLNMRIDSLNIKNLRLYGDQEQTITFDPSKKVTVLLGDNGAGKTSLLYGCSVLLSQFFDAFPNISKKDFTAADIRNVDNEHKADYLHMGGTISVSPDQLRDGLQSPISIDIYRKGESNEVPSSVLKNMKEFSLLVKKMLDENIPVKMPILAYYGTERGQIMAPERRRDFNKVFPRWDSYDGALDSATNFKRFFMWFERKSTEEMAEQKRLRDFDYSSYVLDAVRSSLDRLFPHYRHARVEYSPLRFVMDDVSDNDRVLERRIEQMSDGYRITVALVADIAARMAEANPSTESSGLESPLQAPGIIMIDEIDLHLHPILQRDILRRLTSIFPNVQFIVSTHSPNVVIGSLDFVQVIKLDDGVIDDKIGLAQYENYDVNLLLLSQLFGLDNVRTNEYLKISNRYEELLAKQTLDDEEKQELDQLAPKINRFTSAELELLKKTIENLQHKV